jgi:uncharacterized protein (UPF0218 family)
MVRARDSARPEELEGGRDSGHKDARKVRAKGKLDSSASLVLTPSLRKKLKKPVGELYPPSRLRSKKFLELLRASPFVITVGDRVTETMQELGRSPDVQIVDEVERRVRRGAPDVPYLTLVRASNPAGTITSESIEAIQNAFASKKPARVLIKGEEDLLVVPAIRAAPLGSTVYYGQPGEGVVMVTVDDVSKASAKRILGAMKKAYVQ